ncbi:MAG: VOC family protein [Bdellovibrionales bacterium]|nr:VOC family protein [Bdellovibrionales bacterium]
MGTNPVKWFELYVHDMKRAREFYEQVFQVELQRLDSEQPELYAFPMNDGQYGAAGALARMEGVEPGGCGTIVYFHCDDCAVEAERLGQAGGRIVREKMSIGQYGFIALGYDTEGNLIGLHSMV